MGITAFIFVFVGRTWNHLGLFQDPIAVISIRTMEDPVGPPEKIFVSLLCALLCLIL